MSLAGGDVRRRNRTEIKGDLPDVRIQVLTSFADDDKVFLAIKSGSLGYLLKDSSPHDLLQSIRDVHCGESSLHPTIARKQIDEMSQPSDLLPAAEPLELLPRFEEYLGDVGQLAIGHKEGLSGVQLTPLRLRTLLFVLAGLRDPTVPAIAGVRKAASDSQC